MVLMLIAGSTLLGHFSLLQRFHDRSRLGGDTSSEQICDYDYYFPDLSNGSSFIDDMAFMVLATPIFYP